MQIVRNLREETPRKRILCLKQPWANYGPGPDPARLK